MRQGYLVRKLFDRRAQILLPSVLLAPIFILVIYLLFETAKVSMTKVRHQFALDNAAYSQLSVTSVYLNGIAMTNAPMPFRVMRQTGTLPLTPKQSGQGAGDMTLFKLFYESGAVPSLLGDTDGKKANLRPSPESVDWQAHYNLGPHPDEGGENKANKGAPVILSRADWEKETPKPIGDSIVRLVSREIVDRYFFPANKIAIPALVNYIQTYVLDGSIYTTQHYSYEQMSKNSIVFRDAYFLNVSNCKRSECARESASQLRPFSKITTKPFEIDKFEFFLSDSTGSTHGGAYGQVLSFSNLLQGQKLYQFGYLDPESRSKLRMLQRGVLLKQKFQLPRNHFNIDLEEKYKPYVRTKALLTCPRNTNNCVWPNPLPKYNVTLDP